MHEAEGGELSAGDHFGPELFGESETSQKKSVKTGFSASCEESATSDKAPMDPAEKKEEVALARRSGATHGEVSGVRVIFI